MLRSSSSSAWACTGRAKMRSTWFSVSCGNGFAGTTARGAGNVGVVAEFPNRELKLRRPVIAAMIAIATINTGIAQRGKLGWGSIGDEETSACGGGSSDCGGSGIGGLFAKIFVILSGAKDLAVAVGLVLLLSNPKPTTRCFGEDHASA